ncbi:ABC transporter ATP-binding protein [Myxococcota bacterium]|nr:ABC transporter ATP-binding protein [Myxococcota bacterium]
MNPPATAPDHAIVVEDLSRHYGPFRAVDRVSFHVERGEIFGWLGANGAGKSTTIRMLCGLLQPTSGDATVAGHRISRDPEGVKRSIGYMSQKFSLYLDLTVEANMEFFGGAYGIPRRPLRHRMEEIVGLTGLAEYRGATTGQLPGGIRQRLALGCAMLHRPEILFLDEPTAGVDPVSRRDFWRLIRRLAGEGTTVFVTTHYMDEAEYCARIGLMVDGHLVALDDPAGLKRVHVPGRVLDVRGEGLVAALPTAREVPGVMAAEPFGAGVHVRFDTGTCDDARVLGALREGGARVAGAEPVEATLEDVFLAVVARGKEWE